MSTSANLPCCEKSAQQVDSRPLSPRSESRLSHLSEAQAIAVSQRAGTLPNSEGAA
jgi:hypothetical protein